MLRLRSLRGPYEGWDTAFRPDFECCAAIDQQATHLKVATTRGIIERQAVVLINGIGVSSAPQK
jgi:hypothetical protein